MINQKDKDILRSLAFKIREYHESDENKLKAKELSRLNAKQHGIPLVICSPEGSWDELVNLNDCVCEASELKRAELELRRRIFQFEDICDDCSQSEYFNVAVPVTRTEFGVEYHYTRSTERGSFIWEPPIKDINKDFDKLKFREFTADKKAAFDNAELYDGIFGDLLKPSINCGGAWWSLGICEDAIKLVGLDNFMLWMYDEPEGMQRLMSFLRDDHINAIKWFEDNESFLSDGKPLKHTEMGGFSEAQESVGISPVMFNEFIMQYQYEIMKDFATNHYGCCEPVHDRWQYVKILPRLSRVSISPWCDQTIMVDALKRDIIYNRKPNPSPVCVGFDEKAIRADLRFTLDTAGQNLLEIILKDTHTVENDKTRFKRYVEIARQEIDKGY